jgi:predicted CoA-binding protein
VTDRSEFIAERILRECSTIAVVGMSRDRHRSATSVPLALAAAGFRIVPVNPHATELHGHRAYPTLAEVPEPIELVLVFRPSGEAAEVARQAVQVGARALWLQQGIVSAEARRIAEAAGLLYVEDRCAAVDRSILGIRKN